MSFRASGLRHLLSIQYCVSGRQCEGISMPDILEVELTDGDTVETSSAVAALRGGGVMSEGSVFSMVVPGATFC